jgi:glycosyltransferase involved in cell wall biosynthesis
MRISTTTGGRGGEPLWVTVLMPVYNGERYVATAIESVLSQTHREFEFLIIDDGSTDRTPEILARYAARDSRIRVVRHENIDQPATLNRGLALARHDWVAILDHDDVCLPERLQRQIRTLHEHPEARLIGTWVVEINAAGQPVRTRARGPLTVEEFRQMDAAGFRVPLMHPSVLMHRASILGLGGYDPAFGPSADTELWTRVARQHPIVVTPEPLVLYRIHGNSMSFRRLFEQREMLRCIVKRDRARRESLPIPSLAELRAARPYTSLARWLDLHQDLYWYFRSHCLLASSEGAHARAAVYGTGGAVVSPVKAIRSLRNAIAHGIRRGERASSGRCYQLIDLELSEPFPTVMLGPEQDGVGLIGRWQGRIIGFTMLPMPSGAILGPERLRELVDREFTGRVLTLKLERRLAERWKLPGRSAKPTVSVAICTKDRPEGLARLLASLEAVRSHSPFASLEILVVDNASRDASTSAVVERFPEVRYVHERRPGLNFARNAALQAARGDLLAFLDDDVVVDRHWLDGVYEAWSDSPDAGGFTGLVLPLRLDTRAQIEFEREGGFGRGFERIHHSPANLDNPLHPVGAGVVGAGCNMIFDRALLLELGGFDEALDTGAPLPGGGDLDIFYRVLRAGRTIVYEPQAAVFHEHRKTMSQLRRQYWSWGLGFMSFLTKARRTDAELRPRHRAMLRWWFAHQARAFAGAVLRLRFHRSRFVLSELRGGVQGVLGEYDRSIRRIARIRRQGA